MCNDNDNDNGNDDDDDDDDNDVYYHYDNDTCIVSYFILYTEVSAYFLEVCHDDAVNDLEFYQNAAGSYRDSDAIGSIAFIKSSTQICATE